MATSRFIDFTNLESPDPSGPESAADANEKRTQNRTVLGKLLDDAQSLVWTPGSKDEVELRNGISDTLASVGKTTTLFARGWVGRIGTAGLYALDGAKANDTFPNEALDMLLGATKGVAMRGVFKAAEGLSVPTPTSLRALGFAERMALDAPSKGIALGIGSRFLENMTDRQNYSRTSNGGITEPLQNAFKISLSRAFDGGSLLWDGAIFGTSELLMRGLLKPGSNAAGRLLQTTISGGVFGASSGAAGELQRQSLTGNFDLGKVLESSLSNATITAVGAGLSGVYNLRFPKEPAGTNAEKRSAKVEPRERMASTVSILDTRPESSVRTTGLDHLVMAPKYPANLPALRGLLREPVTETITTKGQPPTRLPGDIPADYKTYVAKLPDTSVEMNVYRPQGLPEIALPKWYDAELNPVRQLRQTIEDAKTDPSPEAPNRARAAQAQLDAHRYGKALLPEELLTALAHSPQRGSMTRITMSPEPNPEDAYYAKRHNMPDLRSQADVSKAGEVTLYQPQRDVLDFSSESPTRHKLIHEWAHLFRWQLPTTDVELYDRIAALEPDKSRTPYSMTSSSEDMAKNVVKLLHGDPSVMVDAAESNPLRSALLSRLIDRTLEQTPQADRSKYHDVYRQKLQLIRDISEPLAMQALLDRIQNPTSTADSGAAKLLTALGWSDQLAKLQPVHSLDFSRSPVTDSDLQHLSGKTVGRLDVSSAENLTSASAELLGSLRGLHELHAPYTNFGSELLGALGAHPDLRVLDLRLTRIPTRDIQAWGQANPQVKIRY